MSKTVAMALAEHNFTAIFNEIAIQSGHFVSECHPKL